MKKENSAYEIYVTYCYSSNTFNIPENGILKNPENDNKICFENKEIPLKIIDELNSYVYYLNHGEQGRPEYKVRKVRKNSNMDLYEFFSYDDFFYYY